MSSLDINGTPLEYVERGSGETLVFVHGSVSDYRTWQVNQESFSERFHTVAYSRRYHWPNTPIAEGVDYSMAEHVDDLQEVLRALNTTPVHLVGHSYGAFLCLLLAIRDPQAIRTLVLAEPPAITLYVSDPPKPQEILKLLISRPRTAVALIRFAATGLNPAGAAFKRGDIDAGIRHFGMATLGRDHFEQLSAARLEQVKTNLIQAEFFGSGYLPLDLETIRRIQIPVLLLTGQQGVRLFHRVIDRLQELLPHAERVEIPASSHIMHEDNPGAYKRAVMSFIERHQQPA